MARLVSFSKYRSVENHLFSEVRAEHSDQLLSALEAEKCYVHILYPFDESGKKPPLGLMFYSKNKSLNQ